MSAFALVAGSLSCAAPPERPDDDPARLADDPSTPAAASAPEPSGPPIGRSERVSPPPLPVPKLVSTDALCKLINGAGLDDPSANQTHFRANLAGTDLGIPVAHGDTLYLFFGDTTGYEGIWQFGESLPDSVGYSLASVTELAKDPSPLCTKLRFLVRPAAGSVGPTKDARIETDFAAASMTPPPGEALASYVKNPAGHGAFPSFPGDFEVPSGAFSYGGSIYLFYTTVDPQVRMKASYLARWASPSTTGLPAYDILYPVDERFDADGALRGDFINVAALVHAGYVYVYGTGEYRASPIQLARKPLSALAQPGGFERFDAATRTWRPAREATTPIVADSGNGELSVRYYPEIRRFMMLNQRQTPGTNRVVARFAEWPEGPWSDEVVVHDSADPALQKYCCAPEACASSQLLHCDKGWFYGTYLFPDVDARADGTFVVTYTMSTWDPYDVALMRATFSQR